MQRKPAWERRPRPRPRQRPEPVLRVMVEAERQEMVDQWTAHLAALADEHLNAA